MLGAEVWKDAVVFHPVVCYESDVSVAGENLPQHIDTVIHVLPKNMLGVLKCQWPVFRTIIVLSVGIRANQVLLSWRSISAICKLFQYGSDEKTTYEAVQLVENLDTCKVFLSWFLLLREFDCQSRLADAVNYLGVHDRAVHCYSTLANVSSNGFGQASTENSLYIRSSHALSIALFGVPLYMFL